MDDCIHSHMFPLGRKHVSYGANPIQLEILGILMVQSLMKAIPKDEVGENQHEKISDAYFVFFKLIVYWLKFGFTHQNKSSI